MRKDGTTDPASDSANGALTQPPGGEPAPGKGRNPLGGVCHQQGLVQRWNGSTWSADINGAGQALVLGHG